MLARTQEEITKSWKRNDPCKVSVICMTYNHEKYISEAIDGMLMQVTDDPFEIIIHDDASTDNTTEIIKRYVGEFPQIIRAIIQSKNTYSKGASPLLRSLLDAKGEYIAVCEGDDYWVDSQKLQKQLVVIEGSSGCSIVSHNVYIKDCTVNMRTYSPYDKFKRKKYEFKDVINRHFVPTLSILFKKTSLPIDDPLYLKGIRSRDIVMELILLTFGYGIHLKDKMGVYRHHDGGITKNKMSCHDDFSQHTGLLAIVACWAGDQHKEVMQAKKTMLVLEREYCLLKKGDVYAGMRIVYVCVSRPIISAKYIAKNFQRKFFS